MVFSIILAEEPLFKALEKLIKNKMADTQDAKQRNQCQRSNVSDKKLLRNRDGFVKNCTMLGRVLE